MHYLPEATHKNNIFQFTLIAFGLFVSRVIINTLSLGSLVLSLHLNSSRKKKIHTWITVCILWKFPLLKLFQIILMSFIFLSDWVSMIRYHHYFILIILFSSHTTSSNWFHFLVVYRFSFVDLLTLHYEIWLHHVSKIEKRKKKNKKEDSLIKTMKLNNISYLS